LQARLSMYDPLHKTITKLTTDVGTGNSKASMQASRSAEATLDAASAADSGGGLRRPFIAPGVSDPMGVLPVLNAKYVRECTEMHLSGKDITKIGHFDLFVNLNVLWLNKNRLKRIDGLNEQIRMFDLYVQQNQITTLQGSLQHMKFLKKLLLHENNLKNLDQQVEYLARLPFLEELTLFGNPLAEERNYRLKVIYKCPSVHILDRHEVTEKERFEAAVAFAKHDESSATRPPSYLCWQQADSFRQQIAFGMKKPGIGRGPSNPAGAAASIHLTLEVGRPWQSPMWNPAPWRPIYDPAGMSENEIDLLARVQRIHREERQLEKARKLVERETVWMERMEAQMQLARAAMVRAQRHTGETAAEAVDMAATRVLDLQEAMEALQRYMTSWTGECTIQKDAIGGFGVTVDGGEGRPVDVDGVVIGVAGPAAAAGLYKNVRVSSVNGVAVKTRDDDDDDDNKDAAATVAASSQRVQIEAMLGEAAQLLPESRRRVVLGLVAVRPKEAAAKWSTAATGTEKKLSGIVPAGGEELPSGATWNARCEPSTPPNQWRQFVPPCTPRPDQEGVVVGGGTVISAEGSVNELGAQTQVWPLPKKLDYEATRGARPPPWLEAAPQLPDGGEADHRRLAAKVFDGAAAVRRARNKHTCSAPLPVADCRFVSLRGRR
jgi:hypothetical protein